MIQSTDDIQYNEWQVKALAESVERNLKKAGEKDEYNEQIKDYLDRGVLQPITKEDIRNHEAEGNKVAFISHHAVIRPEKATTRVRVVSNSSLKTGGTSPNDLWPKGPKSLKPMVEILLCFRCYEVALHFDLTKMYHPIFTSDTSVKS